MAVPAQAWVAVGVLDRVQSLGEVHGFDPTRFHGSLIQDLQVAPATMEDVVHQLDGLRQTLDAIDKFSTKCLRVLLTHTLAMAHVPAKFQTYITQTISSYADDPDLLGRRISDVMARIDPQGGVEATRIVVEAADRILALRAALRTAVMEVTRTAAAAARAIAVDAAKDLSRGDADRACWRLVAWDLELLRQKPERLEEGSQAERLKTLPPLPEEPEPDPPHEVGRFDGIEVD